MKRHQAIFGASLAATLVLAGQGALPQARAHAAHPAASSSTLTVVMANDAVGLDPQAVEDNSAGFVTSTIFDQLLEYKPGTTTVGPGLATGYTLSNGGKTYTFTLRQGVKFQDGTPFNAGAVVQDLDRELNPHNKYYVLKEPGVESFIGFTYGLVKSYTAVNANTVRISRRRSRRSRPAWPWSGRAS